MSGDLELPVRRKRSRGGILVGGLGVLLIAGSAISNALASEGGPDSAWSPAMLTFGIVGCIVGALIFWMDATDDKHSS